jgi:hypothetical protein
MPAMVAVATMAVLLVDDPLELPEVSVEESESDVWEVGATVVCEANVIPA